jgi:septum formation protein
VIGYLQPFKIPFAKFNKKQRLFLTDSPKNNTPALVLASGSPRRKMLLKKLGLPFSVHPGNASEHYGANERPANIVQTLALRKARDVSAEHPSSVIIGADTIVVHRGDILEKPESPEAALTMLSRLSDDTHAVLTGMALLKTDNNALAIEQLTFFESTDVIFGALNEADIEQYVLTGSPFDKAGGYGIQDDWGARAVKRINGDYYNIVGLPVHALYSKIKILAPNLFKS